MGPFSSITSPLLGQTPHCIAKIKRLLETDASAEPAKRLDPDLGRLFRRVSVHDSI
jgi:hypothetical protein